MGCWQECEEAQMHAWQKLFLGSMIEPQHRGPETREDEYAVLNPDQYCIARAHPAFPSARAAEVRSRAGPSRGTSYRSDRCARGGQPNRGSKQSRLLPGELYNEWKPVDARPAPL